MDKPTICTSILNGRRCERRDGHMADHSAGSGADEWEWQTSVESARACPAETFDGALDLRLCVLQPGHAGQHNDGKVSWWDGPAEEADHLRQRVETLQALADGLELELQLSGVTAERDQTRRLYDDLLASYAPPPRDGKTWIQTFTGRQFWPLAPRAEDVVLRDIAHALALECRYTGHTRWHYSVAQHSILVSKVVPPELALVGLMHDATEAYLKDLPRPIKRWEAMAPYKAAEERLHRVIAEALGFPVELPPEVKAADEALLAAERRVLMAEPPRPWIERVPAASVEIEMWTPEEAEARFMERFRELTEVRHG